jgi:hypothetical protein
MNWDSFRFVARDLGCEVHDGAFPDPTLFLGMASIIRAF